MTVQLATERGARREVARYKRARAYSGPGFGPRSFECLGVGVGLGIDVGDGRVSSAGTTPLAIWGANCILWYNSVLGSSTSSLTDQSAGGNTATGTGTINATDATLNNLKTVNLLGTTNYVASGFNFTTPGTTPFYTFVVAKTAAYNGSFAYDFRADSSATVVFGGSTQSASLGWFTNGSATTVAMTYGVWSVRRGDFTNRSTDVQSIGAASTTSNLGNTVPGTGLRVGGSASGQALTLYELFVVNVDPTAGLASYYAGLDALTGGVVAHV